MYILGCHGKYSREHFFVAFMELITRGGNWCKVLNIWWMEKGYRNQISANKRGILFIWWYCNHWMPPPWKRVYYWENQKIHQKLQHLFKVSLIVLANTATPGQYTNSWPCQVSFRVITRRPVAFCSWLIFKVVTTSQSCKNISNYQICVALLILYPKLILQWPEHWIDCFTYLKLPLKNIICIRSCFHL